LYERERPSKLLDRHRTLLLILCIGILIRLFYATSTIGVESWGHYIFYRTVKDGHILDFYRFNLDDPLSIYVYGPVWMVTMIQYSWTDFHTPCDPCFWLFSRTPIIVADALSFLLIYLIGQKSNQAFLASTAFYLNPFTILVGSARGSFDSIGCCLLLLSMFLISKGFHLFGSLTLALTMLTKPYFYFAWPLLIVSMIRTERDDALKIAGDSLLFLCLISMPFLLSTPNEYLDAILVRRKWGEGRTYALLRRPSSGLWYLIFQHRKEIAPLLRLPRLGSNFFDLWIPLAIGTLAILCIFLYLNPVRPLYRVIPLSASLFCLFASPINLPFLLFPLFATHLTIALEGGKRWAIYSLLIPLSLFGLHSLLGKTLDFLLLDDTLIAVSIVLWLSLELTSSIILRQDVYKTPPSHLEWRRGAHSKIQQQAVGERCV